uniref:Uncharacterized protein n=1 Tax=Arion vulgaris TaxID=1028688 RepID=A0A0B7BJ79_9EUPU
MVKNEPSMDKSDIINAVRENTQNFNKENKARHTNRCRKRGETKRETLVDTATSTEQELLV